MNYPFIGFDIDDVVFHTYPLIAKRLQEMCGIELPSPTGFKEFEQMLNPSDYRKVIDAALEALDEFQPVAGSIAFLKSYQQITKHQLVFVTSRMPYIKEATHELLKKWLGDCDFRIRFPKEEGISKGDIAVQEGFKIFIEDRYKYVMDICGRGILVLMPNRSWNAKFCDPLGCHKVIPVNSYEDINLVFHTIHYYQF